MRNNIRCLKHFGFIPILVVTLGAVSVGQTLGSVSASAVTPVPLPTAAIDDRGRIVLDVDPLDPGFVVNMKPFRNPVFTNGSLQDPDAEDFDDTGLLTRGPQAGDPQPAQLVANILEIDQAFDNPATTSPMFAQTGLLATDTGCKSVVAGIGYKPLPVPAPLKFPKFFTPPKPLSPGLVTGPITGAVGPAGKQTYVVLTGFYHLARLNGKHGCFSQQYKSTLAAFINTATNTVDGVPLEQDSTGKQRTPGALAGKYYHDDKDYSGNTRTGIRMLSKVPAYQGTPDVIQWLDTPGQVLKPGAPVPNSIVIVYTVLLQVVWDSGGKNGTQCTTLTVTAVDAATRREAPANKIGPLIKKLKPAANVIDKQLKLITSAIALLKKRIPNLPTNPFFLGPTCKRF